MPTKTPRVSVLTPIYNTKPEYLRECIESILNQTFTDFEFLILNDSPDNTEIEKIVLEYAKHDKRIKYSKNEKNMGITPSRNKLLKMARGEYLAIFDHDDISVSTRLEQEVAFLDKNPYIGVVSGLLQFFGIENRVHHAPANDPDIKMHLTENCYVAHTAAMIRKSVLVDNNIEYEEKYSPAEDYRLWTRLLDVTNFYNFQEPLVKYRWNGDNTTVAQQDKMRQAWFNIHVQVCEKHPYLRKLFEKNSNITEGLPTKIRIRLFGFVPLFKVKNHKVYLFEIIPILKFKHQ
ncbi:MAG: glycosyltransferase [Alphaproteobacteria bacterium]|nr:glycosyltransferase [Alphaproteobacteria bacterium]